MYCFFLRALYYRTATLNSTQGIGPSLEMRRKSTKAASHLCRKRLLCITAMNFLAIQEVGMTIGISEFYLC
jgi:hypothetical protein